MATMIVLDHLAKRFGPLVAVDGISLSVAKGEVLGFLGPNGAGKTTTMRMLAAYLEPSSGTARICDHDVIHHPLSARRHIGYLPEGAPLYGEMRCRGFLEFVAALHGLRGGARTAAIDRVIDMVALQGVLEQKIETLSKGFKRRVGLAQALIHDPDVLILDEPTDGLDPNQKQHVRELITAMAADKAIIVSTHILEEVEAVCTRAVIIDRGQVVADGTAESLLKSLPRHNATVVRVPAMEAPGAAAVLSAFADAALDREAAATGDLVTFHIHAGTDGDGIAEIAHRLKSAGITVEALYVERGRLEDVFRTLTRAARPQPDAGEGHHA